MVMKKTSNLIWLDLEMTGLDITHDHILEIATIVTDAHLRILAEGPVIAVHQPPRFLKRMDEWNVKHHGRSGLVDRVRKSRINEKEAEELTLSFLKRYVPVKKSPMCGNSIYQDRKFLAKFMPKLEAYFYYRNLDVSTIKELAKRWAPEVFRGAKKDSKHIALEDIKDSIAELAYYRERFFK